MNKEDVKEGVVVNVRDGFMWLSIEQKSACSGCHAKGYCASTDCKTKLVKVRIRGSESYKEGDKVNVSVSDKVGLISVFIAFVIPLLIIVLLIVFMPKGLESRYLALIILFAVVLYYIVVYLFRNNINRLIKVDYKNITNDLQ